MNILLTNDDGIHAPGLKALCQSLPQGVRAMVVAPETERSACGHSISLGQKLRVKEFVRQGIRHYAVNGTPADCIKFALYEFKHFVPNLVVSGINQGANTGVSVYYSGTISAAREGLINRIPSIAVSLCSRESHDFGPSKAVLGLLIDGYVQGKFPRDILLNVNVPALAQEGIRGVKITKQASSRFIEEFILKTQSDGQKIYTLAGKMELYNPDGTSDEEAVSQGFISVTSLKLDLTDYEGMAFFRKWMRSPKKGPALPDPAGTRPKKRLGKKTKSKKASKVFSKIRL